MKVVRVSGMVLVLVALLAMALDVLVWLAFRVEWSLTGDYTHWAWYYYDLPYYHIIGLGALVAALGAMLALIGDGHERRPH